MKLLKVIVSNPDDRYIDMAVDALREGEIIIYPTDSIYALGCDALNNNAIEQICKIKGIRSDKTNLSIICESISQVAEYARIDNKAFALLKNNLPGPFTFILPALSKLPKAFKRRKTVGIRIPDNNVSSCLVHRLGNPIMTTSVKFEDIDYGCEPELIAEQYANVASLLIDAGRGDITPSTIVDCTGEIPEIVREGKGELK